MQIVIVRLANRVIVDRVCFANIARLDPTIFSFGGKICTLSFTNGLKTTQWATWLVLVALACAVGTWIFTKDFMCTVTVLVVFCPCAFIFATPTAVLAGIGNATKYGIIIRSGNALEKLSRITRAAFDKIGTLTYGKMQVCDVKVLNQHVIARSEATKQSQKQTQPTDEIASSPASRVALNVETSNNDNNNATQIFVAIDKKLAGVISLSDTLREDAPQTIAKLKSAGVNPVLLTGDNEAADAVLVSDDIKCILYLFSLTKKVMGKIKVNITAAMFINFTAVVLSALGILNPITDVLWHNCGSVFVVVNAAMLLRFKDKE